jgi:hypothetical protein
MSTDISIYDFFKIPLRLSILSPNEYPLVISLWYKIKDNKIHCITHKHSKLLKYIESGNKKCGFEISTNNIPYSGIRGKGDIQIDKNNSRELLLDLFSKYEIKENSKLFKMLMKRMDEEYSIIITPKHVFHWDFTERMKGNF